MARPIIQVENLGKSYTIRHQQPGRGGYRRLSEELWDGARRLWRRSSEPRDDREEFWALKNVSFEVQEGEVVGIIGRNGAGKSTLLKILSRITEPTEGRITLRGRVASLLEVGTGFHPELTGRENIFLNGAILGMTRAEVQRKFEEIVDFAGVEKFLDTPVKRYSSGMYVRLAFAVAAHLEPEILVVDEVLAVGDVEFQRKCLGKMGEVASAGRTVLFVSHNMAVINRLCSRSVVLTSGSVTFDGETSRAIADYESMAKVCRNVVRRQEVEGLSIEVFPSNRKVQSRDNIEINLRLSAQKVCTIFEIVVILYTHLGTRVGIIELNKYCPLNVQRGDGLDFFATIKCLNFVEGIYIVGVYILSDLCSVDIVDLAEIEVIPRECAGLSLSVSKYLPIHRGVVDLECGTRVRSIAHELQS